MPTEITTVDFETESIERRPAYPPKPVGVAIKHPGKRSKYLSWGAPTENNCTQEEAGRELRDIWRGKTSVLCQHGKFDLDVGEVHMGLSPLPWERTHDTEYLLFLKDPHARSLALKESAHRILDIRPEERDLLKEWILAHVPEAKRKPSTWGAYICKAPGKLVGTYANGDALRTRALFDYLMPDIQQRGMAPAYDRERRLMPVLLEAERLGIRADLERMEYDYVLYLLALEVVDNWLRRALKRPELNLDADKDVADALHNNGIVTDWVYTAPTKTHPGGVRSVAKKNMTLDKFHNKRVAFAYGYRTRLSTCINMFLRPWLAMARESGGSIFCNWNQVRQDDHGGFAGARTGRLSSNPNFMNIPTDFLEKDDGYAHPSFLDVVELPLMRKYLLPDAGETWGKRDYSQQELRVMAHFEDGALLEKYNADPDYDMHDDVKGLLLEWGLELHRRQVKIFNFGDIYGMGVGKFAAGTNLPVETVKRILKAKRAMMPDYAALSDGIQARGKAGEPITTWGGRQYYCEEPMYVKKYKRVMTFEYKLLNYLIQGSSADCTKEAVIRYHDHPKRQARFLVTVHDEIDVSMPDVKREMPILKECMEGIEFDLTMYSDGETGPSWGNLKEYKEQARQKKLSV